MARRLPGKCWVGTPLVWQGDHWSPDSCGIHDLSWVVLAACILPHLLLLALVKIEDKLTWSFRVKNIYFFVYSQSLNEGTSLPKKLFYPVVHGTTDTPMSASPANVLVVLQRFKLFSRYRIDGLSHPKFLSHHVLNHMEVKSVSFHGSNWCCTYLGNHTGFHVNFSCNFKFIVLWFVHFKRLSMTCTKCSLNISYKSRHAHLCNFAMFVAPAKNDFSLSIFHKTVADFTCLGLWTTSF